MILPQANDGVMQLRKKQPSAINVHHNNTIQTVQCSLLIRTVMRDESLHNVGSTVITQCHVMTGFVSVSAVRCNKHRAVSDVTVEPMDCIWKSTLSKNIQTMATISDVLQMI
jgi:hypothetical protein